MSLFESLIVGIVQGITEWLPISSEGMTSLVLTQGFGSSLQNAIIIALWLHLGTLLAAIVHYRKDIKEIIRKGDETLSFLAIATIVSVILGAPLLIFIMDLFVFSGQFVMIIIGILLLLTGFVIFFSRKIKPVQKKPTKTDAIITGIAQGVAVLPGLSRSGLTVAALLFRRYNSTEAIRLSFLMSIPAVAIAGLYALTKGTSLLPFDAIAAFISAFIFGMLTITAMIRIAKKVNFGVFVLFIGILSVIAGFI